LHVFVLNDVCLPSEEEMELNKDKKMKSEQAVLPNPCLKEEEEE
jgi:hypothetical protein